MKSTLPTKESILRTSVWSSGPAPTCGAEFLYLLGVKPVWQKGSLRVTDLEVIPLDELKRPRIDVTARISGLFRDTLPHLAELMDKAVLMAAKLDDGLFRDTLPHLAELMDKAVLMVAKLDESDDDNFVRKHIREDSEALQADGASADDAWRNAAFRVFGDAPGTYGSGINVVLDAKNWESEKDLADVYVRWGGHVFGGGQRGVYQPELFSLRRRTAGRISARTVQETSGANGTHREKRREP